MRRRVFRSPLAREWTDERESVDAERLLRFSRAWCFWRCGGGERERERLVDMVETESADEERDRERDRDRLWPAVRPRSSSFFLRMSSATPFLRSSSLGTSVEVMSLGLRLGLRSCWVRDERGL